jgi:ribosome assembly protein YihI (activator of Der GTPase)
MVEPVRYVTDPQGERVGVLLDLESYRQLTTERAQDPECLEGLSREELEALSVARLAPEAQAVLDRLLERNAGESLSAEESARLDELLARVDHLALLVARARYTLHQLGSASRTS